MFNTNTDVLLAGAFAAFSVDLLVYPLDTLKTRFQSPDFKKIYYDASANATNRGVLFRGLYQGVGSVILVTIPSSGAFFTTYEAVKSGLSAANPIIGGSSTPFIPQPFIHSAASATAELVSCFILTPAEVLKQNAQMIRRPVKDSAAKASKASKASTAFQASVTMQALKQFKTPSQLWRGYTALAARNLPFTAMQFPMYEHLKKTIDNYRKEKGTFTGSLWESGVTTAISAGSAGSVASVITTPVDVIKTRIMLSASNGTSETKAKSKLEKAKQEGLSVDNLAKQKGASKKSGRTVAREVMRENGIKGLFRGGTLRAVWTALGMGLYLGVYETGRIWLGDRHQDNEDDR